MNPLAPSPAATNRLEPVVTVARCEVLVHPASQQAAPQKSFALAVGLLIVVWVVLNLAYLVCNCPFDLAPDEAHYWHWSRQLDWSYYSKGPLIAWLIRGSCELFGELSNELVGSHMLAVRLPALLSSGVMLAGLYSLALPTLRSGRAALAVVAAALTLPPIAMAAVMITTDPPFLACWAWALVFVGRAVGRAGVRAWVAAGVCCALGVLAKYPMLLLPATVVGFLFVTRRAEFRRPGVWIFLALTALGCIPIVVWGASHDWVSLRHALGQTGIGDGVRERTFQWTRLLGFVAGQFGVLLGFWFLAFLAAGWRFRVSALQPSSSRMRGADPGDHWVPLLWWTSLPVWGVFFVASSRNAGQLNWPAAAYVGGLILAAIWIREQLDGPRWWRRLTTGGLVAAMSTGVILSGWIHYPGLLRPTLARLVGPGDNANPTPVRKLDPTCRLLGWQTLAAEVDRIRDRVKRETGEEPALAGMLWTTPGELAFYGRDHPLAYSFGLALADRHSQYDVWRPNPVVDPQAFLGRSFVYIGDEIPAAEGGVFDRVEPPLRVIHTVDGVPVAAWTIWVGHGFRGLPASLRLRVRDY